VQDLNTAKCKKQLQLSVQDPNLAKSKQTKASNKQQTSEQAPTGPTAAAGPQTCKLEPNNNKQQPTNQRTNEQATTTEPVNNICIFNDDQIAFQA
jgi:hypothetical protein